MSFRNFKGQGEQDRVKAAKGQQRTNTNAKLAKSFQGARTFKDKDGNVRATKSWAQFLKSKGSRVVSKDKKQP